MRQQIGVSHLANQRLVGERLDHGGTMRLTPMIRNGHTSPHRISQQQKAASLSASGFSIA
jgi:hypothetical protein